MKNILSYSIIFSVITLISCNKDSNSNNLSEHSQQMLQQAMRNTEAGHDTNFSDNTPFIFNGYSNTSNRLFEKGGNISIGAALNFASLNHDKIIYKSCYWELYGKKDYCKYPNENRYFELYNLWGVLFSEKNNQNPNALINVKNFRFYVLYKGENVWRRVHFPETDITDQAPITWAATYYKDIVTEAGNGKIKVIQEKNYSTIPIAKSGKYDGKWYDAKILVNHFGSKLMKPVGEFTPSKVEGVYMQVEVRLDPSTPNAKVGIQAGMDVRHEGIKTTYYMAFGSTRIVTVAPHWKTVNWVNYAGGQGADEGGVVLSKERLLNTSFPRE